MKTAKNLQERPSKPSTDIRVKPSIRSHAPNLSAASLLMLLILFPISAFGKTAATDSTYLNDSLKASLLTCSPGQKTYEYYGHTAIRIQNISNQEDYVFNYGLFSFNSPNFIWRFMRGDCQYEVGAAYTAEFLAYYAEQGRAVRELVLNLSQDEAHRLFQALTTNCRPENRSYQYNFFYNNCATKVRDQIEACLKGGIIYTMPVKKQSLRDIIHEYCQGHPWSRFSQDLLLGAEADKEVTRETQEFAPLYLERDISTARTGIGGQAVPLVSKSNELVKGHMEKPGPGFPLTPRTCAIALCALSICFCLWERKHPNSIMWGYDLALMLAQGITGCIVAFLFFFSNHPTVNSNWLILLFNPLPLIFLYHTVKAEKRHKQSPYNRIAFVWILLFIISGPFLPQKINIETYLLALCLLIRSGHNLTVRVSRYGSKSTKLQSLSTR